MNAFRMRIATALTAAAVLATSFVPVSAAPVMPVAPMAVQASASQATKVQYRRDDRDRRYYRHDRDRRHYRHDRRAYREGYYNGHRGYRERRQGYRYHNGYWFPLAAFGAAAIIGGAIANQPRASGGSHYQWCANRYRTYRASDNTYVASAGVRRSCVSPYR
jgi:hypothetical protein